MKTSNSDSVVPDYDDRNAFWRMGSGAPYTRTTSNHYFIAQSSIPLGRLYPNLTEPRQRGSGATTWSMIVCSGVLSFAAAFFAAAAMPTPFPTPCPNGPVVDSTPGV